MIPAWLLWSSVGMLAREVLPESMFPSFGKRSPAPRGRQVPTAGAGPRAPIVQGPVDSALEPVQASAPGPAVGRWDDGFSARPSAPDSLPAGDYVPLDPSLPMDEHIDPETERGVIAALAWEDDRQLDGFAQSISHQGDPFGYGYYPIAAGYLRYRAKIIREAQQALAQMEAQQQAHERLAKGIPPPVGVVGARGGAGEAATLPKGDANGTTAPVTQAPPPSMQVLPAVRVKIRKSPAGRPARAPGRAEELGAAAAETLPPKADSNGAPVLVPPRDPDAQHPRSSA